MVIDEIKKDVRERGVKELLYANDLMLFGDSWDEIKTRYARQWQN